MGAVPSREITQQCLPRTPFYGQRQRVVLIPLTAQFFPSADCPLFHQLYAARCDPGVRYYHYNNIIDNNNNNNNNNNDNDDIVKKLDGELPPAMMELSPSDVFPGVPCSRAALYADYITHGGERLMYDTTADMLHAHQVDPVHAVRPLPCAVAFVYTPSGGSYVHHGRHTQQQQQQGSGGDAGGSGGGGGALPDGCVEVLGCYVKVTGFIGDIGALQRTSYNARSNTNDVTDTQENDDGNNINTEDINRIINSNKHRDSELHLYLTKSAGDHNRSHVLFSAVYTYAEQWQRACTHNNKNNNNKNSNTNTSIKLPTAMNVGTRQKSTQSVAPFIPLAMFHSTRALTGGASAAYKKFMERWTNTTTTSTSTRSPFLLSPTGNASSKATCIFQHRDDNDDGNTTDTNDGKNNNSNNNNACWYPPPLTALRMRSRRSNVPLLCFAREVRAVLLSLHAACTAAAADDDNDDEPTTRNSGSDLSCSTLSALEGLDVWLEDCSCYSIPPSATTTTAVADHDEDKDVIDEESSSSSSRNNKACPAVTRVETMVCMHAPEPVVQSLVEYILICVLQNINPSEMMRVVQQKFQKEEGNGDEADDAVPKDKKMKNDTPITDMNGGGDNCCDAGDAQTQQQQQQQGPPQGFLRMPDVTSVIERWPPLPTCNNANNDGAADLTCMDDVLPQHHLYWVVGADIAERRSATRSVEQWLQQHKRGIITNHPITTAPAAVGGDDHDDANKQKEDRTIIIADDMQSLQQYTSVVVCGCDGEEKERLLNTGIVLELLPVPTLSTEEEEEEEEEQKDNLQKEELLPEEEENEKEGNNKNETVPALRHHRALRVCRLPVEELLLGELRDACKLAREAGPEDARWVRHTASDRRCATAATEGHLNSDNNNVLSIQDNNNNNNNNNNNKNNNNGKHQEESHIPAGAVDIVGDGSTCLWRVLLSAGSTRIIAVTPHFMKVQKKKNRKKVVPRSALAAHGTAADVFFVTKTTPNAATSMSTSSRRGAAAAASLTPTRQQQMPAATAMCNAVEDDGNYEGGYDGGRGNRKQKPHPAAAASGKTRQKGLLSPNSSMSCVNDDPPMTTTNQYSSVPQRGGSGGASFYYSPRPQHRQQQQQQMSSYSVTYLTASSPSPNALSGGADGYATPTMRPASETPTGTTTTTPYGSMMKQQRKHHHVLPPPRSGATHTGLTSPCSFGTTPTTAQHPSYSSYGVSLDTLSLLPSSPNNVPYPNNNNHNTHNNHYNYNNSSTSFLPSSCSSMMLLNGGDDCCCPAPHDDCCAANPGRQQQQQQQHQQYYDNNNDHMAYPAQCTANSHNDMKHCCRVATTSATDGNGGCGGGGGGTSEAPLTSPLLFSDPRSSGSSSRRGANNNNNNNRKDVGVGSTTYVSPFPPLLAHHAPSANNVLSPTRSHNYYYNNNNSNNNYQIQINNNNINNSMYDGAGMGNIGSPYPLSLNASMRQEASMSQPREHTTYTARDNEDNFTVAAAATSLTADSSRNYFNHSGGGVSPPLLRTRMSSSICSSGSQQLRLSFTARRLESNGSRYRWDWRQTSSIITEDDSFTT